MSGERITSAELEALYESVKALAARAREQASDGYGGTREAWGVVKCLEDSLYDLWGAFGYAAIGEGLLER